MSLNVELFKSEISNIVLTVALPVYNSYEICWLSLESLCEQKNIDFDWELIIYEEIHDKSVFPNIIEHYYDRLKKVRCARIFFITNTIKVGLVDKWITIGKNSSDTSKVFLLQAADCFSPKNRLKISYDKIVNENFDWYDQIKGYFYSFISDRIFLYDIKSLTNLNMSLKIDYIKSLPYSELKKGIDGYIHKHVEDICHKEKREFKHFFDDNLYDDSLDTQGYNNISLSREGYFILKPNIFKKTNMSLDKLESFPKKIINNLKKLKKIKNKINYELSILISTFDNVEYLDSCFKSIQKSIGNQNVEVLIGIDSCLKTKDFVMKNDFPDYFRFYFFEKNNGPYIVFNTLSKISSSDNIMFFGSDDIMDPNMIDDMVTGLLNYDCVKPQYKNFTDGKPYDSGNKKHIGEGVFAIKKEIFDYLNGFEPWMCSADSDFMGRLYKQKQYSIRTTTRVNFYRRIHKNGLTSRPDTGMGSKLRAHYSFLSRSKKVAGPLDNMVTEQFTEIKNNVITYSKKTIENIIPSPPVNKTPAVNSIFGRTQIPIPQQKKEIEKPKRTEPQIKERPKIEPKKEVVLPEENKDTNTLSNKAKEYIVYKKAEKPKKIDSPKYRVGKDSLRI